MKKTLFLFFFLTFSTIAFSQNYSIQGIVVDAEDGSTLSSANVLLIRLPDSTKRGLTTDSKGTFNFQNVAKGKFVVKISFVGYHSFFRNVEIADKSINLGKISLREESVSMKEVEIRAKHPIAEQKNDTTEFQAGAFKTNPDATAEDLVGKLPGVTVQGGRVQAQGEDVKQVLVDNRPFFGFDPTAVLRALPAEIIDRVQVFDRQSEQSQFTGVSDGNESKTINIITKGNFRNSQFGKFSGAYGHDNVYKATANINWFKGDTRISFIGLSNNVNEQNFATEDILGVTGQSGFAAGFRAISGIFGGGGRGTGGMRFFGGGPGGRGGGGGSSIGDFLVNQQNGIATTHSTGLNYSDKWDSAIEVSGSYFFNSSTNDARNSLFRQYVSDSAMVYNESTDSDTRNMNHRFNFRFDYQIDSSNSVLIRPRISLQQNDGTNFVGGNTMTGLSMLNKTSSNTSSDLLGINASNELLYRHKFETRGRTFSVNLNTGYNRNSGDSYLLSENIFYGKASIVDSLDQYTDMMRDGWSLNSNVSYTEPVTDKSILQFNYTASRRLDDSDRRTFKSDSLTGGYDILDEQLSNTFNSKYTTHAGGASWQIEEDEINATVGASFQWAKLSSFKKYPIAGDVDRTFQDILPNAMLRYKFSRESHLRFFYRTRTNPPSVDQLQNVIDNSNPLQLSMGNPELKQDFSHYMNMMYATANIAQATYFFGMIGGSITQNSIGNKTIIATADTIINNNIAMQKGIQLRQPVNLDGAFSLRSMITYGFSFPLISSNVNLNAFANLSRTPGLINNNLNYAYSPSLTFGAVISSNISPELDFTISSQSIYSIVNNTLQKELNTEYFVQNSRIKFNWIFWEGFVFQTDLNHQINTGLSEGFDKYSLLWNMSIGKKFLVNNAAELKLSMFDVLKQNNNIQRNVTEAYIEDTRSNVLQRYVLLTFTYNLKNFPGS